MSDRWMRLEELFHEGVGRNGPERARFLDAACGDDPELRRELEALLASHEETVEHELDQIVQENADHILSSRDVGGQVGPYHIIREIARGGMGAVYLAERSGDFTQRVALKVVQPGLGQSLEMLVRFRAERQILANLNHPNIAKLLDGGVTDKGSPYLVMEYIEGTPIDVFCRDRRADSRRLIGLVREVCSAVQHAHQNLVVHRDLKPSNVLVIADGTPKLLDFGIAKLLSPDSLGHTIAWTRPAERLMTPEYASPEQIRGEPITTATDIYGLGVLLYELLTGKRPFQIADLTPAEVERLICETPPERPSTRLRALAENGGVEAVAPGSVSGDLDNIVLKAMHKDPSRRYATAAELSEDLRRYLDGFPVSARPDSWQYRTRKFILRHKLATAAAALFIVTTTGLSIALTVQAARAQREADTADQVSTFLSSLFENTRPDRTQGRSTSARDLLDSGAKRISTELQDRPLVQARLLDTLGSTYYALGALDEGHSLEMRSYDIRTRLLGHNNAEAAHSLQTLGEIATDRGEFANARTDLEQVLNVYAKSYGKSSAQYAEALNDSANVRFTVGDLVGAEKQYRETIALWTSIKGPDDPHTLTAKSDLMASIASQGNYAEAARLAKQILAVRLRVLGRDHPDTGATMINLATNLGEMGQFEKAEAMARQGLAVWRKVYGTEHPDIAHALEIMGWLTGELGKYDEAVDYDREAYAMAAKLQGPHSAATASDVDQLGVALLKVGALAESHKLLTQAFTTFWATSGPHGAGVASGYDHLGLWDLKAGNLKLARKEIEEGLEIRQHVFGAKSSPAALSLNHLGDVLVAQGEYAGAEQNYRKALTALQLDPYTGPATADAMVGLGKALTGEGKIGNARTVLTRGLQMRRALFPAGHPEIVQAEIALARCTKETASAAH